MSAEARVPANTNSTRYPHFRALFGKGLVWWAVLSVVAFTIGAAKHSNALMAGAPIALAVVVLIACWYLADKQAENEFFKRFADAHKMTHSARWSLYELTPLLGGGDRRRCEHWMETDGTGVGIGWYTFEVRHDNGDNRDTWEPHNFTVSMIDIGELGTRRFQGIYMRRKRGILEKMDTDANWLGKHNLKKVELESTAFCDRYELWAEEDQDDVALRQLFAPTFQVWLTEHPLHPGFELRAGTLVVFIPDHCGEAGKLDWLLMAGSEIAKRIQLELTEAAQAGRPL